jgi:hypothetical protein
MEYDNDAKQVAAIGENRSLTSMNFSKPNGEAFQIET